MQELKVLALVSMMSIFAPATEAGAQTRTVTYVTASYVLKAQQALAGTTDGVTYVAAFSGEAKAVNNRLAADIKSVSFTISYTRDGSVGQIQGGFWAILTVNKDRSPLIASGSIAAGGSVALNANGSLAPGGLSLLLDSTATLPITGTTSATIDRSNPPKVEGGMTLTYPVIR